MYKSLLLLQVKLTGFYVFYCDFKSYAFLLGITVCSGREYQTVRLLECFHMNVYALNLEMANQEMLL